MIQKQVIPCFVGYEVGCWDGRSEGWDVGCAVGCEDGSLVGWPLGCDDGCNDGLNDGCDVGRIMDWTEDRPDGCEGGWQVGAAIVGVSVGDGGSSGDEEAPAVAPETRYRPEHCSVP